MLSMNMPTLASALIDLLQVRQCALFVMWSTNVTMLSWRLSEVRRSEIKLMLNPRQWPLVLGSGCRRPMGFLIWWLAGWHKLPPGTYHGV